MARVRLARVFERGLEQARRLCAAGAALECRGCATRRWSSELWTHARPASCSSCPATRRSGFACRCLRCRYLPPSEYPHVMPSRSVRRARARCRIRTRSASRSCSGEKREARRQRPRYAAHGAGQRMRARRSPSSRATAGMCVFMPPVAELEDYLDLLAAVEDTSAELDLPIHLEGYEPPRDPRLERDQGDAGSRRHRGQRAAGRLAGTRCARSPRACTRTRTTRGS